MCHVPRLHIDEVETVTHGDKAEAFRRLQDRDVLVQGLIRDAVVTDPHLWPEGSFDNEQFIRGEN